jgi:LysR family transcriptional regulator for bpeEF and oprC
LTFVRVIEERSVTAGRLPKRKIKELEPRLGAQLLQRTTRRLGLTEPGTLRLKSFVDD